VPQLEQLVRLQLRAAGSYTLVVDPDNGVESEKGLGALLGMPEATAVLGESLAFELRALLVEQQGANLRNHLAHGLLTDGEAWSAYAVYACWLALRLAVIPVWLSQTPQTDSSAGSQPFDPPEGAEQEDLAPPKETEPNRTLYPPFPSPILLKMSTATSWVRPWQTGKTSTLPSTPTWWAVVT
jgi:hypothetical protein